jgi:hypothetical protein
MAERGKGQPVVRRLNSELQAARAVNRPQFALSGIFLSTNHD